MLKYRRQLAGRLSACNRFLTTKWTPNVSINCKTWGQQTKQCWDNFVSVFVFRFGSILGAILKLRRTKNAKMDPTRTSRASTYRKHLQQMLFSNAKTIFFESWTLPRRASEILRGSQEAPEELQDLKKDSKN